MQQHTVAAINIKTVTHESTNDLFFRLILKNKLWIKKKKGKYDAHEQYKFVRNKLSE